MTPQIAQQATAVKQKWDGFIPKIDGRVKEVIAEADAGFEQLIAEHGLDPGPLGAAFSALQTRFRGITQKLDEAWAKVDRELDDVRDGAAGAREHAALGQLWAAMRATYAQSKEHIDIAYEHVQTRNNAAWARFLFERAQRDAREPVACSNCGAGLTLPAFHQSSNVACSHCGALNQLHPGIAAGLLFQGGGLHALSHEAAWNEWLGLFQAEKRYKDVRVPITRDREALLGAARVYWTKYYETYRSMHPGFDEAFGSLAKAVDAKLAHYGAWDPPLDQMTRAKYQVLVDIAATGDRNRIVALLQGGAPRPEIQRIVRIDERGVHEVLVQGFATTYDLDDAVRCVFEHGDTRGALILLEVQYTQEGEDDPFAQWSREQIARMARDLASRGSTSQVLAR